MFDPTGAHLALPAVPTVDFAVLQGIPHGVSTRHGGVSAGHYATLNLGLSTGDTPERVLENRSRFFQSLRVPERAVVAGRLTHGRDVCVLSGSRCDDAWFVADAAITDVPGKYLFMTFADCVPILLADPARRAVGLVHAGWRGTSLQVAAAAVQGMVDAFGSRVQDIRAGIGPSIGPCCYEVGEDVRADFARNATHYADAGESHLDLWESNWVQLLAAGLEPEHIELCGICTSCHVDDFFSHRAERGRTGRLGACIGLEA